MPPEIVGTRNERAQDSQGTEQAPSSWDEAFFASLSLDGYRIPLRGEYSARIDLASTQAN